MGFSTENEEKKRKHFGKPLKESILMAREDGVSHIVESSVRALIKNGMNVEGIFRVPGDKAQIYSLKEYIDQGKDIGFDTKDPFDVGGVLKLYLYELPDSLFPSSAWKEVETLNPNYSDVQTRDNIKAVVHKLPPENLQCFKLLVKLFKELIAHVDVTKMSANPIITSIGPSIFLSPKLRNDPVLFLAATQTCQNLGVYLLQHMDFIFFDIAES